MPYDLHYPHSAGHHQRRGSGVELPLNNNLDHLKVDTSVGLPPHMSVDMGGGGFDFDLTQAIPEGFGIGQLGWERAFTSEGGISPTAFGLDTASNSGHSSAMGMIGDGSNPNTNANTPPHQVTGAGTGHAHAETNGEKTQGSVNAPPLLTAPNFLLPWFPTVQEQSLILHYCANAADLMIAIPVGLNPMLAVNLPLALASPRGTNAACDALRLTLLGIGAVHQAFLLARSGVNTMQTTATFQYASNLRDMGKEMVRRAVVSGGDEIFSDAALSASTSLATIDIFFGGTGWQDNLALAKRMVAARGGPSAMLQTSVPTALPDGTTVTPVRVSPPSPLAHKY